MSLKCFYSNLSQFSPGPTHEPGTPFEGGVSKKTTHPPHFRTSNSRCYWFVGFSILRKRIPGPGSVWLAQAVRSGRDERLQDASLCVLHGCTVATSPIPSPRVTRGRGRALPRGFLPGCGGWPSRYHTSPFHNLCPPWHPHGGRPGPVLVCDPPQPPPPPPPPPSFER